MKKKIKLLLVEDEKILAAIIVESFEKEKIEVMYAPDGQIGLEFYKSFKPDICLIDIIMPNKDGMALLKEIRCYDSGIPIILLSSKSETFDVLEGFRAGADDYLKKPFSMEELKLRIYSLLKRIRGVHTISLTNNEVNIGLYVFDYMKQELRYGKDMKRLSRRESEILKTLTDNGNIINCRKDLLINIWGDDSICNSRSLDVYITKIRKYLVYDKNVQIINSRGRGYRLCV